MLALRMRRADYQQLYDYIQAHTGLLVAESRFEDVGRLVDEILFTQQLNHVSELLRALDNQPITTSVWQALIQAITIGETYFFRNLAHFTALRTHVLPQLISKRRAANNKLIRIWSAGCASGEEPYSLAILLRAMLPDFDTWHITILGTDINLALLERARRGVYRNASFRRETPSWVQPRWFTATAEGHVLDRVIRDHVIFSPLNLADDDFPSFKNGTMKMDLILCRNVTIYFAQQTTRRIAQRFYQALNEGGWLIVGHSEPLATTYQEFIPRNFAGAVFYQKDTADTAPPNAVPDLNAAETLPARPKALDEILAISRAKAVPEVLPANANTPPVSVPDDLQSLWARAKQAADSENWDEALRCITQAERTNRFLPEFHYLRGLVQQLTGDVDGALWSLRQALYCDADFVLAHYHLGELYDQTSQPALALRHWRRALTVLHELDAEQSIPFVDELTVGMLQGLLSHRIDLLEG